MNIIGVMTGTEIALERMKKVLGNVQEKGNKNVRFLKKNARKAFFSEEN